MTVSYAKQRTAYDCSSCLLGAVIDKEDRRKQRRKVGRPSQIRLPSISRRGWVFRVHMAGTGATKKAVTPLHAVVSPDGVAVYPIGNYYQVGEHPTAN